MQTGVAYDTREPFRFKKRLSPHYGEFGEGALLAPYLSASGVGGHATRCGFRASEGGAAANQGPRARRLASVASGLAQNGCACRPSQRGPRQRVHP